MKKKLVNMTPHDIVIIRDEGQSVVTYKNTTGIVPRVAVESETIGYIDDVPIVRLKWGTVRDLPDEEPGTYLIVSSLVCQACPDRHDLLYPDTGPGSAKRDPSGRIIGVKNLVRN